MDVTIGSTLYDLGTTERNGQFTAHAVTGETRERFGIETSAGSAAEALDKLTRWLEWQHDHAAALVELQRAQHTYHKAVADHAFEGESGPGREVQRATLDGVDAARQRLDAVRQRRPVPA